MAYTGVGVAHIGFGDLNDKLAAAGYETMKLGGLRPSLGIRIEGPRAPALALSYGFLFFRPAELPGSDPPAEIYLKNEQLVFNFEFPLRSASGFRAYPGLCIGFGRTLIRRDGPHIGTFDQLVLGTEGTAARSQYEALFNVGITGGYLFKTREHGPRWTEGLLLGIEGGVTLALANRWRDGHKPAGVLLPLYYFADHGTGRFDDERLEEEVVVGGFRPYLGLVVGYGVAPR
jgi:hypothetical protein